MKELNPVEKQRRQEKLKAKKKLKEDRKIQQASTKDISKMEQEILNLTQMDQSKSLDKAGRAKKAKLEADLSRIKRTRQVLFVNLESWSSFSQYSSGRSCVYTKKSREINLV